MSRLWIIGLVIVLVWLIGLGLGLDSRQISDGVQYLAILMSLAIWLWLLARLAPQRLWPGAAVLCLLFGLSLMLRVLASMAGSNTPTGTGLTVAAVIIWVGGGFVGVRMVNGNRVR